MAEKTDGDGSVSELKHQISELKDDKSNLEGELTEAKHQIEQLQSTVQTIGKELCETKEKLKKMNDQHNNKNGTNSELEKEEFMSDQADKHYKRILDLINKNGANLNKEMNEFMKEAIDKCRNARSKKEVFRLRKEVDYYKKLADSFHQEIKSLKEEVDDYKKELDDRTSRMQEEIKDLQSMAETTRKHLHDKELEHDAFKRPNRGDESLVECIRNCEIRDTSVSWDDIVGLENAKCSLEVIVVLPAQNPQLFVGLRTPAKGVLLFGPPGNGKTLLAKAVAHESKSTFFNISGATILSKWLGVGEKLVKAMFDEARKCQPAVIFIDEVDSLLNRKEEHGGMIRIRDEFLQQCDGMNTSKSDQILVMVATNRPEDIDEAALSRLPEKIYISLPNLEARAFALQKYLKDDKHEITHANLLEIARKTEKYSFRDLYNLATAAAKVSMIELTSQRVSFSEITPDQIRPIKYEDFVSSLSQIRPSVEDETIKNLEEWNQKYGSQISNTGHILDSEEPKIHHSDVYDFYR